MNAPLKRSDSIAEGVIVAIVVIVLGIAATSTRLDPASNDSVDQIAAKVRMQMPIARVCANGEDPRAGCMRHVASGGQP